MSLIPMGLFVALIVILDQISKFFVVRDISLGQTVPCIAGVFHLTYVENYGAAFSILQGHRWFFILVFVAFVALLVWASKKNVLPLSKTEWWFIAAIVGGGLGNILDRVFRGFVVDMIAVDFIRFPVFNVADCFITCGAIGLIVHMLFFNKDFWKSDKKSSPQEAAPEQEDAT